MHAFETVWRENYYPIALFRDPRRVVTCEWLERKQACVRVWYGAPPPPLATRRRVLFASGWVVSGTVAGMFKGKIDG
jgi:hypothetical protein